MEGKSRAALRREKKKSKAQQRRPQQEQQPGQQQEHKQPRDQQGPDQAPAKKRRREPPAATGGSGGGSALLLPTAALPEVGAEAAAGAGEAAPSVRCIDQDAPVPGLRALGKLAADDALTSDARAAAALAWLVAPLSAEDFLEQHFERRPLLVRRRGAATAGWYRDLLSTEAIRESLRLQRLVQGEDLTVTHYDGRQRADRHAAGQRLGPRELAAALEAGSSVRLLCPQRHHDGVWYLLSALEEAFGCMVGANAYLTPAASQGFAPHYDDIDAFICQLEGRKRWRVYSFPEAEGPLPRFPSEDLTQTELPPLLLETVLEPGDLLFLPRGFVHQAETVSQQPSLHLTVSAGQNNAWADLLELLVPQALAAAAAAAPALRRSLPSDYTEFMGAAHSDRSDEEDPRRAAFRAALRHHLHRVVDEADDLLDAAADQMAKRWVSDRLPPPLTPREEAYTAEGGGGDKVLGPDSRLRLVRRGVARLVVEDGMAVLYHCMENARAHHAAPLRPLEFPLEDALAIDRLLAAYPEAVRVRDLPHPPTEDLPTKITIATALFREGILLREEQEEERK